MDIAFLVHEFPRASQPFVLNQVTGLLNRGHSVKIYSRGKPNDNDLPIAMEYDLDTRTVYTPIPHNKFRRVLGSIPLFARGVSQAPVETIKTINLFRFGRDAVSLRPLYRIIPMLGESFDIVHCHFGPNGRVGTILTQAGIEGELVTTFHGYGVRQAKQNPRQYRNLFNTCDRLLANSKYTYDQLSDLGVDKERLLLHPNGINLKDIPFRWKGPLVKSPEKIEFITVARLAEEKGIEYGIRAIGELVESVEKEVKYHIVGDGEQRQALEALTEQLELTDVVVFHGYKNRQYVFQHLARSHIFVLPSIEEGFGMVLLEAQAIGLPVVATTAGGIPEAVDEGNSAFLVEPGNPTAMARELYKLVEVPNEWASIGRDGRDYVARNFDIETLNDELEGIYRSLV